MMTPGVSLWQDITAPLDLPLASLQGDARADVVIIGCGILGLSVALHLAEAGADVKLIEADSPGFGASGRNTGFVVPALRKDAAAVEATLGPERGRRLLTTVATSADRLFEFISRHHLAAEAEQTGWLCPAHGMVAVPGLERRVRDMEALGRKVEFLDAVATERMTGIRGYPAAILDRSGGQLNPLAYSRALARRAAELGARLHFGARVTGLQRKEGRWVVSTAGANVDAGVVVLATNALDAKLRTDVARSIHPVTVHQIATVPLEASARQAILPGKAPITDTRRHSFALRWSREGRLLTGGLVVGGPDSLRRAWRKFEQRLGTFLPGFAPFRASHVWRGVIASAPDALPHLYQPEPGLFAPIFCNGRGVALATILGGELAGLLAGALTAADITLRIEPPAPIPGQQFLGFGPSLWLPWNEFLDHRDRR